MSEVLGERSGLITTISTLGRIKCDENKVPIEEILKSQEKKLQLGSNDLWVYEGKLDLNGKQSIEKLKEAQTIIWKHAIGNQELPSPPEESDDVDTQKIVLMPAEFAEGNLQAYTDYKKKTLRKDEEAKKSKKLKPVKISKN